MDLRRVFLLGIKQQRLQNLRLHRNQRPRLSPLLRPNQRLRQTQRRDKETDAPNNKVKQMPLSRFGRWFLGVATTVAGIIAAVHTIAGVLTDISRCFLIAFPTRSANTRLMATGQDAARASAGTLTRLTRYPMIAIVQYRHVLSLKRPENNRRP